MFYQGRIRRRLWAAAIAAAAWGLSGSAWAQLPAPAERGVIVDENLQLTTGGLLDRLRRPAPAPAANCPNCAPSTVAPPLVAPVDPKLPPMPVDPKTPSPIPPAPPVASFEDTGGGGGDVGGMAVPNIMGNLFGAGKSVSFFVSRSEGGGFLFGSGSTSGTNYKIADNNSPIPRDRFSYRYNYFENAASVSGAKPGAPRYDPDWLGNVETPFTSDYDANMHSFDFEKTFANGRASIQVRVPFVNSVSPNLNLTYGTIDAKQPTVTGTAIGGGQILDPVTKLPLNPQPTVLNVHRTPLQSLGNSSTELGNIQVIFKGIVRQSANSIVSAGLGVGIPTGPDTNIRVTDYLGNLRYNNAEFQRVRQFQIDNDTWALSPFVAFVLAPEQSRWFSQGFLEVELPLNSSNVRYRETLPVATGKESDFKALPGQARPPIDQTFRLNEQALLHLSWGTGFWAVQRPDARFITGIAPTLELHYTTALNSADIIHAQADNSFKPARLANGNFDPNLDNLTPTPGPVIGNARNRFDLLDLTTGATFLLGNRATFATGVSVPLRGGDNRTYDWELQFQLNYYFGAGLGRRVPNF